MTKISDELRKFTNTYDLNALQIYELKRIADSIDAEMVELPKDRDGVPIHVGDTVYMDDGHETKVIAIRFNADNTTITCLMADNPSPIWCAHETLSHTRSDSWERIADELDEQAGSLTKDGYTWQEDAIHDFADRIRKLAKEEDER